MDASSPQPRAGSRKDKWYPGERCLAPSSDDKKLCEATIKSITVDENGKPCAIVLYSDFQEKKIPLQRLQEVKSAKNFSRSFIFDDEDLEKPYFPDRKVPPLADAFKLSEDGDSIPYTINRYLRDYQREGAQFLYRHYIQGRGCILGDDMGLGKTIQVISFLAAVLHKKGTREDIENNMPEFLLKSMKKKPSSTAEKMFLIVAPLSVLYNWKDELDTWGYFRVTVLHGSKKDNELIRLKQRKCEIALTTYETLRLCLEELNSLEWSAIIVDEAHRIKNPKARITEVMKAVKCKVRIGLTGTVLQNNMKELWCVMDWAVPGLLGSRSHFKKQFSDPVEHGQRHTATKRELATGRKAMHRLAKKMSGCFLRRTKTLIKGQLPKKEDRMVYCSLTEFQKAVYQTVLDTEDVALILQSSQPCTCGSGRKRRNCCHKTNSQGDKVKSLCLSYLTVLQKVANHVALLQTTSTSTHQVLQQLLNRIREKERRNQEAHQEKEVFAEKTPLFGEPYKTAKGDELSSRIQNMLGDYEKMKEFLSTKSCPQRLEGAEDRPGKPRYPSLHDRGSNLASHSFRTHVYHQPIPTSAPGSLSVGNISHSPKMAPPRMEPVPSLHAKSYGPPDSQRLTQDRLSQEGHCSSHRKCDRRADGDSAPEMKLSPLISSLPSPVPPLSPVHSRLQGPSKVPGSSSTSSKSYCAAVSSKDLVAKGQDNETPLDSLVAVTSLGVAPSQTFPPPPLPSKSVAMQQKPTAYVRPMDGQDQAPSESPELKPPLEDYGQQSFEKPDVKVPAKAKLTRLRMPSQSVEQTYSNEAHCVEEILKEMTHSWPPPLTAIHTPSTAEPSRFPFPTKDPLHISSAAQSQKQYDSPCKTHPSSQQGTSMLEDDLQLSDSEDSDMEQAAEEPRSPPAPPSAPQPLPEPVVSAHSSSAESESSASDSSSDSETESSSSDTEENEPLETPAPEPEPPTTNKWQLDNWLTRVSQPPAPLESRASTQSPRWRQESKDGDRNTDQPHPESKDPPPKSSSKTLRGPTEGPQPGKRSCQKSPAQQEPPPRQTIGTKQPRKPAKGSGQTEPQGSGPAESEPGPLPYGSKDQTSKDKPKVKTKGRPRAVGCREPKPEAPVPKPQAAVPTPNERRKHKGSPAPSKAPSGPQPPKDNAGDRKPEHFALVSLTQSQGPPHSGRGGGGGVSGIRTSGCRQAVIVQEDGQKDRLLVPLRDTKLLSPLRDTQPPTSLVVKITLDLLTRIPQPPGKGGHPRKAEDKQLPAARKQDSEKRSCDGSSRVTKKRKGDPEKDRDNKKIRLQKDVPSHCALSSSSHTESSKTKAPRPSSESSRKEMLPPPPVSSSSSSSLSSSSSSQKSTKTAHKRSKPDADACGQDPPKSASSTKGNKDSSIPKHRKVQARGSEYKGSSGEPTNPFPVPSLPNGNCKPGKPQAKPDRPQADFHMKEAKKLKSKAEAMADKTGKAFKYLEAVLSFIECGMATESEGSAKAAYAVYSEAIELIRFTMSLKSFSDTVAPAQEKIFAVLCLRCQSLVNMAMFRCKKDIVMKYSRTLSDHFKSSSKVAQAPSPCMARSTGVPSPLSPMPSPASSVGSQSSVGSMGSSGVTATISTPVTIQNMTSAYVNFTSHVLKAFDLWDQAEALTKKNKDFFAQLSTKVRILALNSSLVDLVHYTRQGLQRLRQAPKTP